MNALEGRELIQSKAFSVPGEPIPILAEYLKTNSLDLVPERRNALGPNASSSPTTEGGQPWDRLESRLGVIPSYLWKSRCRPPMSR
jgi:hypothetical protein